MSDEGVFCVHRGVFKHPFFQNEPYSEREAWFWILGNAAWKKTRVRSGKALVDLDRGQLAYATRFMAEAWGWQESRVRRFLNRAKSDAMLEVQATRQTTLITICNYDDYQFSRRTSDAPNDAQPDAQATHKRRKEETLNHSINNQSKSCASEFDELRGVYPNRVPASPPKPARLKYEAARKRGVSHETILNGARAYAAECDKLERTGTQFVKSMDIWLNQEGWSAYQSASTGPPLPDDPIARRDFVRKQMEAENAAKQNSGTASGNVLGGGDGLRQKDHNGPEKPSVVRDQRRYSETTRSMVQLFSASPGLSSVRIGGDEAEGHFGIPDTD